MTKEELKKINLPDSPGVYMFRRSNNHILYIGKAASLRDRVRSYFASDLAESRSSAIAGMVSDAVTVTWESVDTVLEALILEANLIKKYEPQFNIEQKDNKSFNYLVITKEAFPRVAVVRGRELFLTWNEKDIKHCFGPYPHGGALQEAVKLVRRIFPFRDNKCVPAPVQKKKGKPPKPCFNRQIGLCPGVCTGEMSEAEYKYVIRNIVELFSGGMRSLKRRLEKEMKDASRAERFEKATALHRQVSALTHIRDVSLIKDEHRVSTGGQFRIEAYDVAHTSGDETVGVMTVVEGGEIYKAAYRMFKVREAKNDDTKALSEILMRRLAHPEWQYPKLIVIDGGKGQLNAASRVLKKAGVSIPLVAVTKDEFHRPEKVIGDERMARAYEKEILLANSEAHRFAIRWHRKRRQKGMVE
ncbi:MAG: Uncharacterized protein G01um10148_591 [Parcubacteria group bacterium Gr01-1014_8]|nr:MAG: Uncharacterized protein G01um10148_591 [Parcubacteria group bacterium Gr01-1014_8]